MPRRLRRQRRRMGYEILLLPKDGRPTRRVGLSFGVVAILVGAFVGNLALVAGLTALSGSRRAELQVKSTQLQALDRTRRELAQTAQEQAYRLQELALEAEQLTRRVRELEQLSDEVWVLLGQTPAATSLGEASAGKGGPDASEHVSLDTALVLGSLSSQVPLQLRELEQLRELVVARNHRLEHTPSLWPVEGYVSSEFGVRKHPVSGTNQRHDGIDVAVPRGTPVQATAAGVVTFAGDRGGYGLTVIIDHGYGLQTLYAHNSKLHARKGQTVRRGDLIAAVGTTGVSTGPHLHYEVMLHGKPINPRTHLP